MAPQAKRVKTGTLPSSDHLESIFSTPMAKVATSKSKIVRSKKTDNGISVVRTASPKCASSSFNTTLEPGLVDLFCEPKSIKKSTKKRTSKILGENLRASPDSPSIAELLDRSTKKSKPANPNTVNEVFEKYMEKDPYASIWNFIPRDKPISPDDKPLTFFSPVKERPRTHSAPPKKMKRADSSPTKEPCENANKTLDLNPLTKKDMPVGVVTPIFGKHLGAGAYSPCNSTGRNFSRINCSAWSGLNDTNGSNYSPAPSCSTPTVDPFKTPSAGSCREISSSGVPLSGVKALFLDKSYLADSPADTPSRNDSLGALRALSPAYNPDLPESIKGTILLGVTCYVDCKYNKEDRAKYVQKECIALGAKVEKNFTKKVTHVVFKSGKMSTYMKAKENNIPLVSLLWLEACKMVGNMVDPALYPPTDDQKYQDDMPVEEARRRERFFKRGRAFLDRINGLVPAKSTRSRSGRKGLESATEGKKARARPAPDRGKPAKTKFLKKLDFDQPGPSKQKKPESGDSDYVSESDTDDTGQSKRRKSAPAGIGDRPPSSGGQKKLTQFFTKKPKGKEPEPSPKRPPPNRTPHKRNKTPQKEGKDLMKVLTGGFTTADKKKRKLFDPNQSLLSLPLPSTPIELSPYVKASPNKRSGSRCRTTSSKKQSSRSKTTSSKGSHRVREAKRPLAARKSLVPLMEHCEEEEDSLSVSTSRNSLACFDLTKKTKSVAIKCQPRIAFTSLPKDDIERYKTIISRLGTFSVDLSVTKKTTHLLTQTPVKRTVNLLKALARGCWILDVEWLIHSEKSGKWMSEEPFEQKSFSDAVTACRLEKQAFGKDYCMDLFSGCGPIFVDSNVQPPRLDLISLLKVCCATVVSVSSYAVIIISKRPLEEQNSQVDVISPQWVLDSIMHNKLMDLGKYRI